MAEIPSELRYTKEHEWARQEADGTLTFGITDHAQDALGDVAYVDLPGVGDPVTAGEAFGEIESVKAVSEVYAPCDGEVVAINEALADAPEKVNESPYGEGWLIRVKPADSSALDGAMDAAAYQAFCAEEAAH